jgi:hypothetical protein
MTETKTRPPRAATTLSIFVGLTDADISSLRHRTAADEGISSKNGEGRLNHCRKLMLIAGRKCPVDRFLGALANKRAAVFNQRSSVTLAP